MGNILSAIRDDYDEYVQYCKERNIRYLDDHDDFYRHWDKLKVKEEWDKGHEGKFFVGSNESLFNKFKDIAWSVKNLNNIVQNDGIFGKKDLDDYMGKFSNAIDTLTKLKDELMSYINECSKIGPT